MKIFKRIALTLLVLAAILSLIPLTLPREYHTERSIVIERPVEVVFQQVSGFRNRTAWDPWLAMEPSAKVKISGPTHGIGAKYSWKGEEIGSGYVVIEEIKKNESIKSSLYFDGHDPATVYWLTDEVENGTKITWVLEEENLTYLDRYRGVAMGMSMEESFNQGLAELKSFTEALPVTKQPDTEKTENTSI